MPATSDSDPSTTGATTLSAACGPLSAESPGTTLLERLARPQTWKLSAVTPFSPGAVAARQARDIVAWLSHWLAPQQALSPSKQPLVSNCPLATVRGPAQPLVSAMVSPALKQAAISEQLSTSNR